MLVDIKDFQVGDIIFMNNKNFKVSRVFKEKGLCILDSRDSNTSFFTRIYDKVELVCRQQTLF